MSRPFAPRHARLKPPLIVTFGLVCSPKAAPVYHKPGEKYPPPPYTRSGPRSTSALTGNPQRTRLRLGPSAAATPSPSSCMVGATASFAVCSRLLATATFALKKLVPTPPAAPPGSALPTIRGTLADSCTRRARPIATSLIGKSTSLRPAPCHRTADI